MKKPTLQIKLVSIGPFHRQLEELRGMKMQKQKYLKEFCDRTGGTSKEYLTNVIESNKEKVGRSYSEAIKVTEPLVEEILLDAIFNIELFLRYSENPENESDYILSKPWLRSNIADDLI